MNCPDVEILQRRGWWSIQPMAAHLCAFWLVCSGVAFADTSHEVAGHTTTLQTVMQRGDCVAAKALAQRIRDLDPDYYQAEISTAVAACQPVKVHVAFARRPRPPGWKNPWLAFAAPTAITLGGAPAAFVVPPVGIAMMLAGPSIGRVYIGRPYGGGLIARAIGLGMIGYGLYRGRNYNGWNEYYTVALGGLAVYGGGALYEIVSAPVYAIHDNDRRWRMMPMPTSAGVGVSWQIDL